MAKSNDNTIERIVALMQADNSVDAPHDSIKWVKNTFRTRATQPKASFVQKIAAVLQMELLPQNTAFGERSGGSAQARQMLFEAGENVIDLRIKEVEGGWEIHGQILGGELTTATLELFSEMKTYRAELTEIGEFKMKKVAGGKYDLKITSGDKEILIGGLEFKS